jgi:hypothetical protein
MVMPQVFRFFFGDFACGGGGPRKRPDRMGSDGSAITKVHSSKKINVRCGSSSLIAAWIDRFDSLLDVKTRWCRKRLFAVGLLVCWFVGLSVGLFRVGDKMNVQKHHRRFCPAQLLGIGNRPETMGPTPGLRTGLDCSDDDRRTRLGFTRETDGIGLDD